MLTDRTSGILPALVLLCLLAAPLQAQAGQTVSAQAAPYQVAQGTTPTGNLSDTTSGNAVSTPGNGVAADAPLDETEYVEDLGSRGESGYGGIDFGDASVDGPDGYGGADSAVEPGVYDPDDADYDDNDTSFANWVILTMALLGLAGVLSGVIYYFMYGRQRRYYY